MKNLLLLFIPCLLLGQVSDKANSGYKTREGREAMARNLGSPERAERLKAAEFVKALAIRPGSTVVDIGAGAGVLLPFLSTAVGPQGKVIAEDIFPDFLEKAKAHAASQRLSNVNFVLGNDRDPNLPRECCDLAVTVDAYHHFDYPGLTLTGIRFGLKKGGRFAILDYYKRPGAMDSSNPNFALEHIRIDKDDVIREVEANGFRLLESRDHVPDKQYVLIFGK